MTLKAEIKDCSRESGFQLQVCFRGFARTVEQIVEQLWNRMG